MQNPIPKLRQTSIISKKPGFLTSIISKKPGYQCLQKDVWDFAYFV